MLHDLLHSKDHVRRAGVLSHLPVDSGHEAEPSHRGVPDHRGMRDARADGRKPIERFGVAELAARTGRSLPVARREVVAGRVAEDVVVGVGGGDVLAGVGDDDAELALKGRRGHEMSEVSGRKREGGVVGTGRLVMK